MGRQPKRGLTYFSKDVDYYDDFKIMDLMNEYGPLGQTIYDVVLCMVYHEGYYLEVPSMDHLAAKIIKAIGNRWVKKKDFVLQVIHYCADIGLFDHGLLNQNVITSAGIQRRYDEVTVRNKVDRSKYRLIDKNGQPLLNAPKNIISAIETSISATEIQINDTDKQQNKNKVNNNIYFSDPELENAFLLYIGMRRAGKDGITEEQVKALKEELMEISKNDKERTAIVKKAFVSGWKSFYPMRKKIQPQPAVTNKKNQFHNFDQREYNYENLEQCLIKKVNGVET